MRVKKITDKQMIPSLSFMGKGRHWPVPNKPAQIPVPLKIPGVKKQDSTVKEATKSLL